MKIKIVVCLECGCLLHEDFAHQEQDEKGEWFLVCPGCKRRLFPVEEADENGFRLGVTQ